ncbi:MAG: outer membrane lipoprotein chaperone LolA [Burkholderiales bacterium]|nr:outer membrane lipoprotein chaperone LolA [Burkholderiales bacterium]
MLWRAIAGGAALIALGVGPGAHATPTDQLHAFLARTSSARGDFTQQTPGQRSVSASGASVAGKPVISHGNFEFQRPGRFRWTYTAPYEQLIVSDGQHLFLFDKDLNQVTKKKLAGALPASPASILFGSNDFEHDFTVHDDGIQGGVEWIRATPNARDSLFENIRIGFQDGMPVAMQLRDSFGQATELSFEHVQRNPALAADRFVFTPPKGVDVLEDR